MLSLCFFELDTKTVQSSGNSELGVMQYVNLAEGHAAYHSRIETPAIQICSCRLARFEDSDSYLLAHLLAKENFRRFL